MTTRPGPIAYLPAMFATCMLFQVLYILCVVAWVFFPQLAGHAALLQVFPQFRLLDAPSFLYGFVMSMFYGWFVSAVFVFFYNLWPAAASLVFGRKALPQ